MQTLSAEQRRFLESATTQYQLDFANEPAPGTAEYLRKRGLGVEAVTHFRLGVVRRPLAGHEGYAGRLVIPYLTPAGVVNMNFRCMKAHDCTAVDCRKYLKAEGSGTNLFNVLDLKKDSSFVCVAEGEIDTMSLSLASLPAVGVAGVDTWQKHFSRCLEDFEVIYAFGDGDKAGSKFSNFLARETRARPIRMPAGKDVNDIFREGGPDALRALTQTDH